MSSTALLHGARRRVSTLIALLALGACEAGPTSGGERPVEVAAAPFRPRVYTSSAAGPELEVVGPTLTSTIEPNVAISTALDRVGVSGEDREAIVTALRPHFDWRKCRPGHAFDLGRDADGRVRWFRYRADPTTVLHAYRDGEGRMLGVPEQVHVRTSTVYVEGTITHSLYLAMDAAGEQPALTLSVVDLFAWDIDFFTETQVGDRFRLLVEKRHVGDGFVGYGRILAAEYAMSAGPQHRAFHYRLADGTEGYYTEDGRAVKKAFLKSPIQFASITSRYGLRKHPVLKFVRAHRGVDYGAPKGTAIWAVGDGRVGFAGRKGGYGNVVILRHPNGLETRYAHLSAFGKGVRAGGRVSQKQIIGYVGATGLATGPHLHFEVLRNGGHVNPLSVAVPPAPPVPPAELEAFRAHAAPLVEALARGESIGG